jgi:PAS domain S-box-containing protein
VTAEHRARVALEEREQRLAEQAALLDVVPDAIVVRDLDGRVTFWNRGAAELHGRGADDVLGRPAAPALGIDVAADAAATSAVLATGEWRGERELPAPDGARRALESRWSLLRGHDGEPRSILIVETDVTERRRFEQQLLRVQRLESIGTLAGGIAHDLNNVLAPIVLALDLLREDETDDHRRSLLDTARASARRGSELVAQVLSFARGGAGERDEVSVAALFDEVGTLVRSTFPRQVRLEVTPPDPDVVLEADAGQLHQLLMNLLVNARDALADGGTVRCHAELVDLDEAYAAVTPDAEPGRYARITVEDDGPGMTPAVEARAFEPFFTTKGVGEGTGLGLSTCLGIVRGHGGHLQLYTEPGRGTTFRVYLPCGPVSDEGSRPTPAEATDGQVRGAGELILVVDDEEAVLHITRSTLEAFGYRVVTARDGAEAVSTFARHAEDVALVLTDMMMPIMDGPSTIRALRSLDPQVPIVAASGLRANGRVARAAAAGVRHFLPKPYTADTLLATVRAALDDAEGPT